MTLFEEIIQIYNKTKKNKSLSSEVNVGDILKLVGKTFTRKFLKLK